MNASLLIMKNSWQRLRDVTNKNTLLTGHPVKRVLFTKNHDFLLFNILIYYLSTGLTLLASTMASTSLTKSGIINGNTHQPNAVIAPIAPLAFE